MSDSEPKHFSRLIRTGSRLHFGLISLGNPAWEDSNDGNGNQADDLSTTEPRRWFGGVGVMLKEPSIELEFQHAEKFEVLGDQSHYIEQFAAKWLEFVSRQSVGLAGMDLGSSGSIEELPVSIRVNHCPPRHSGLGVGTQLGLAVGQGLFDVFCKSETNPNFLSQSVDRGKRSAVGTHGFFRGGLLVDRGKVFPEELGLLDGAFPVPEDWRFVLILNRADRGLSGKKEKKAFQVIPDIPLKVSDRLRKIVRDQMIPSVVRSDFPQFSDALYDYGYQVGECFSSVQGGVFAGPVLTGLVERVRRLGIQGVGQSSWGPTLFCLAKDPDQAMWLKNELESNVLSAESSVLISEVLGNGSVGSATMAR